MKIYSRFLQKRKQHIIIHLCFFFSNFRSIVLILIFISEVIDARRRHTSNRHHRNNARTSCHSNGGSCEPMFGCILKQGYMSGSCHGFLQVCCITPTFVSRRFKENSIFDSGPPVICVLFFSFLYHIHQIPILDRQVVLFLFQIIFTEPFDQKS